MKIFLQETFVQEKFGQEKYVQERFVQERFVQETFVQENFVQETFVQERFVQETKWSREPLIRYTGNVRLVGLRLGLFYFVRLSLHSFGPTGQN